MTDKGSMIVAHQAETYVYVGDTGYIVVKQTNYGEDDSVILIDPQNAVAIADAIKGYVKAAEQARLEWQQEEE
jgi:hypothetical protein